MVCHDLHAEERDSATAANLAALREFETTDDDTSYLRKVATDLPGAHDAFSQAEGMSTFHKASLLDAHCVARVVTMLVEDWGPCTPLNQPMAVEDGRERETPGSSFRRQASALLLF
jgi:hypothetical protein